MSKLIPMSPMEKHISRGLRLPLIQDEMSNLLGKVLTVIDASISDKTQCKAVKDLIREHFGHLVHDTFWHYCYAKEFNQSLSEPYYSLYVIPSELTYSEQIPSRPPKGFSMPEVPE